MGDHFFFFSSLKRTEMSMDMMEMTTLPTTAGSDPPNGEVVHELGGEEQHGAVDHQIEEA
jgi:hypothetical protein